MGISHKKIPQDPTVTGNSGFAPGNTWESPMNRLNPEFPVTAHERNRYSLASGPEGEKRHGLQNTKGLPNQSMPTLLNDTKAFGA
jgi:hypothetical protein